MIAATDLQKTARAHLRAAKTLFQRKHYDATVYLCGYAVEIALKARICRTLKWAGFPETPKEFEPFRSLQTHNLETLLKFAGVEAHMKNTLPNDWPVVTGWNPEMRYKPTGTQTATNAQEMIEATQKVLRMLI